MSRPTATLVEKNISGHGGRARLYKLSEPKIFDLHPREYVLVVVQEPWTHKETKVYLFPAYEDGRVAGQSKKDYAGSHTADGNPFLDSVHMEACFWLALTMASIDLAP